MMNKSNSNNNGLLNKNNNKLSVLLCWVLFTLLLFFVLDQQQYTSSFTPSFIYLSPSAPSNGLKRRRRDPTTTTTTATITRVWLSSPSSSTSSSSSSSSSSGSNLLAPSQILKFKEPRTNVTVVLVGAMHYNPASIQLAYDTVNQLGLDGTLGSVIVEQCDIRWNKTNELMAQKPYLKPILSKFLNNEMRTACNVAIQYNRPVILGDQRINLTAVALKDTFRSTIIDLLVPIVGWKRFIDDIQQAAEEAVPLGNVIGTDGSSTSYLNAFSVFDARLLLAAPVSFVKYPLSFLVRNPATTSFIFSLLFLLNNAADSATAGTILPSAVGAITTSGEISAVGMSLLNNDVDLSALIMAIGISFLETIIFARIFLRPMLAERNKVLAKNILQQCKLYDQRRTVGSNIITNNERNNKNKNNWFMNFFPLNNIMKSRKQQPINIDYDRNDDDGSSSNFEIVYAPEMIQAGIPITVAGGSSSYGRGGGGEKTVVAILGMAHCNGIMKLLKEEKVS